MFRFLGIYFVVFILTLFPVTTFADTADVMVTIDVFECSDGVDNDSDGLIDYPNDAGCESGSDDNEEDPVVENTEERSIISSGYILIDLSDDSSDQDNLDIPINIINNVFADNLGEGISNIINNVVGDEDGVVGRPAVDVSLFDIVAQPGQRIVQQHWPGSTSATYLFIIGMWLSAALAAFFVKLPSIISFILNVLFKK